MTASAQDLKAIRKAVGDCPFVHAGAWATNFSTMLAAVIVDVVKLQHVWIILATALAASAVSAESRQSNLSHPSRLVVAAWLTGCQADDGGEFPAPAKTNTNPACSAACSTISAPSACLSTIAYFAAAKTFAGDAVNCTAHLSVFSVASKAFGAPGAIRSRGATAGAESSGTAFLIFRSLFQPTGCAELFIAVSGAAARGADAKDSFWMCPLGSHFGLHSGVFYGLLLIGGAK